MVLSFTCIISCSTVDDDQEARIASSGAIISGSPPPVMQKPATRQTVFASATVPQHNHFIKQCVQVRGSFHLCACVRACCVVFLPI